MNKPRRHSEMLQGFHFALSPAGARWGQAASWRVSPTWMRGQASLGKHHWGNSLKRYKWDMWRWATGNSRVTVHASDSSEMTPGPISGIAIGHSAHKGRESELQLPWWWGKRRPGRFLTARFSEVHLTPDPFLGNRKALCFSNYIDSSRVRLPTFEYCIYPLTKWVMLGLAMPQFLG